MDKKNFSTSYIPLQKPYQIIKYGRDIGMQIGTLVASCMLKGDEIRPFRIESHSYPVVAYADKEANVLDRVFYSLQPMEGVVWNRVELREVVTICLTGDKLTWMEFINFLWSDISRTGFTAAPNYDIARALRVLGVEITPPSKGKHVVHLHCKSSLSKQIRVSSSNKDDIAINLAWDDDLQNMKNSVMHQLMFWHLSVVGNSFKFPNPKLSVFFESDDKKLSQLVILLNNLRREDWDVTNMLKGYFSDLPIEEQFELINKLAFEKAKGI
jgi:hypothetical protein